MKRTFAVSLAVLFARFGSAVLEVAVAVATIVLVVP
jgi:hypothetical protein